MKKVKVHEIRETIIRRNWNGQSLKEIAADYNLHPTTLGSWAKRPEWRSLEKALHAQKQQQMLKALQRKKTSE